MMNTAEIAYCVRKLRDFYDWPSAELFMHTPQSLLGDRKPIDCSIDDVERLIDQLNSGAFI